MKRCVSHPANPFVAQLGGGFGCSATGQNRSGVDLKQDNRFQIVVRPEEFPAILSNEPKPSDEHENRSITANQTFLGHLVRLTVQVIHRQTAALPQAVPIVLTNGVKPESRMLAD